MVAHSIFGGSGGMPPRKNRCSKIDSEAFWRCFKPQWRGASVMRFVNKEQHFPEDGIIKPTHLPRSA